MAAEEKWYFTKKQLENSPSRKCDIDADKELSYRQQAANFIQDVGQRLQVSQLCINTAIVYMHRFYVFHSFTQFYRYSMAAASLFLAAKVEEQPRKLEHVIKVAHLCLHKESEGPLPAPDVKSEHYANLAHDLVFNENVLLQTLGFDVAIDHPHTHVVRCCHLVKASKDLAQTSYFLASNSLHLTTMCLQYKPTVVACFCIHLACKWSNWEIPPSSEGKPWFTYVDESVTLDLLDDLTKEFIVIYNKCPSRLKKKIMSMSANQGQPGGGQSAGQGGQSSHTAPVGGNVNFPMTNCTSPMTTESKKIPTQPGKDGLLYHSKSHHGQPKPGTSHQHRPPHDPNLAYNEHKEKKERERERQSLSASGGAHGAPHHKQPLLATSELGKHPSSSNSLNQNHKHIIPPNSSVAHSRNPHHRASSSSIDPKLKPHPTQYSSSHPRPPNAANQPRPDGHPLHPPRVPSNEAQYNQYQRDTLHRDGIQHAGAREGVRDVGSRDPPVRDPHRDYNSGTRAPPVREGAPTREQYHNREQAANKEQLFNSSERETKDRPSGNVNSEYTTQTIDNYNRDPIGRERQVNPAEQSTQNNREMHKHRPDVYGSANTSAGGSSVNEQIKDNVNSDKMRFEQNRQYKIDSNKATNSAGGQPSNSKHRSREPPEPTAMKTHTKTIPHNDLPQHNINKKPLPPMSSSEKLHVNRSTPYMQQQGNTSGSNQKLKSPYTVPPAQDSKSSLVSTSSPGNILPPPVALQSADQSRNGNHAAMDEAHKRPTNSTDDHYQAQPPPVQIPQKQKSIFSPEKEIQKTSGMPSSKRSKTNKTPPSSAKRVLDVTPPIPSGIGMIPPVVSPFGSPPAFNPLTPNPKNRNRTSSSSSEPELMVVVNKLENIRGYENIRESKGGIKLPKEVDANTQNKDRKPPTPGVTNDVSTKNYSISKDVKPPDIPKQSNNTEPNVKQENVSVTQTISSTIVNGIETDPALISNLLKEATQLNHLSVVEPLKRESTSELVVPPVGTTLISETSNALAAQVTEVKSEHHKSEKKKKKDKHKHKDKNREDKEKKKKHKDKDREKHKDKLKSFVEMIPSTPAVAPLKITIAKDKITPPTPEVPGLKIKIPKERIKTDTISANTGPAGGLKIKISKIPKDKVVEMVEPNRKREREASDMPGGPAAKSSKSSGSYNRSSADGSRQNGRHSYNNKQVTQGEGAQVGGNGAGALQAQAQWSTQVKLAESKYHSKAPSSNNRQPPT